MATIPRISVIIPTHNRASFVGAAIASVLSQTLPAHEIIVVDDGSTDDTPRVLAELGGRIRVVRTASAGVSAARNAGVREATGDWIAFLDDDDEYLPTRLEAVAEFSAAHPAVVAIACDVEFVSPERAPWTLFAARRCALAGARVLERPTEMLVRDCFRVQSVAVRRSALWDRPFSSDVPHEDLDFLELLSRRGPWAIDPRARVRIIRRPQAGPTLSQATAAHYVASRRKLIAIMRRALRAAARRDRRILRKRLSWHLYELALQLRHEYQRTEPRTWQERDARAQETSALLREARRVTPSLRTWWLASAALNWGTGRNLAGVVHR